MVVVATHVAILPVGGGCGRKGVECCSCDLRGGEGGRGGMDVAMWGKFGRRETNAGWANVDEVQAAG